MDRSQGQGRSSAVSGGEEYEGKSRIGFSWEDTEADINCQAGVERRCGMEERVAGRERTEAEEDVGKPRKRIGGSLKDGRRLRWMMAGRRHRKKGYLGGKGSHFH